MPKKPDILNTKKLGESEHFYIEQIHLRFSNGEERFFERILGRARGSVMIVPLLDEDTLLLIREYGAGVDDYVLGFPKGAIESGEDLYVTANRELMEEVGYGARSLDVITDLSASPGYLASSMKIVLAKDLYENKTVGDEPEPIEVVPWSLKNIDELLQHPQFHEARSVAALLLVVRQMHAT